MTGSLRALFDRQGKIDLLDVVTNSHQEYIPRNLIHIPESPDLTQSPKITKSMSKKQRAQAQAQVQPQVTMPDSKLTDYGVTAAVLSFLEVCLQPWTMIVLRKSANEAF